MKPRLACLIALGFALVAAQSAAAAQKRRWTPDAKGEPQAKPKPIPAATTIQFRGTVEARQSLRLTLLPGERAVETFVKLGDAVQKGQPLVRLVQDSLAAGLGNLVNQKIQLLAHQRQMLLLDEETRQVKAGLVRAEALVEAQRTTPPELPENLRVPSERAVEKTIELKDRLAVLEAQRGLDRKHPITPELASLLETQTHAVEQLVRELLVRAPFSGRIAFVTPSPTRLAPGALACEVWDDTALLVRGEVLQHQVKYLIPGAKAEVALDFAEQTPLSGTVRAAESTRVPKEGGAYPVFPVLIELDQAPKWLRPGMTVSVSLAQPTPPASSAVSKQPPPNGR